MPKSWNVKELRDHLRKRTDKSAEQIQVLDSVGRYDAIFRFHLYKARDAMRGIIHSDDPNSPEHIKYLLGGSERQEEYHEAKIESEAHILGAIHSARAMFEVFAFLVNSVVLDGKLTEKKCRLDEVIEALPDSPLKAEMLALQNSYWFGYVAAFVNTAKHRTLVTHSFRVSFEEPRADIRVEGFNFNKQSYPPYWLSDLLEGVLDAKNRITDCGAALNGQVLARTQA